MEKNACPKCKHEMDEGRVSQGGDSSVGYVSDKHTVMLRHVTPLNRARACPNCGYVEMYLDPAKLKERIE